MFNKKKLVAVVALAAFSLASASGAIADTGHPMGVPPQVSTVLAKLVTAGTITQAQSDAITSALQAAAPVRPAIGGMNHDGMGHMGGIGNNSAARQAVITSTLGITADELQSARKAGKSLATIAGSKTDALIAALVNYEVTEIDAAVTAGKITSTQATTMKANLQTRVSKEVNSLGGRGHKGKNHGMAPTIPAPSN